MRTYTSNFITGERSTYDGQLYPPERREIEPTATAKPATAEERVKLAESYERHALLVESILKSQKEKRKW